MRRIRLSISLAVLFTFALNSGCGQQRDRKIKLSSESSSQDSRVQTVSSTLQVDPEEQHAIAILPFLNETNDPSLDWLNRGLADMLTAELSQSVYLNVVSMNRLTEVAKESGRSLQDLSNPDAALQVAKQAKVRTLVRGSFSRDDISLRIYGIVQDVESGELLMKENVQGPNLERIFSMMTDLSGRLAANLRGTLQRPSQQKRSLAAMTHSLEAFRCYSQALDNLEKYFFSEADKCLTDAIALDSTFAAAYLLQCRTKSHLGDFKAIPKTIRKARQYVDRLSESDQIWLRLWEAEIDGDYGSLLSAVQELLDYEPYDLDTRLQLANLRHGLGDHKGAIEEYERILELDPSRKSAYNQLAYAHARRGDFTTAHMHLDKYTEMAADEPNPYDSRGEILKLQGRFDEAVKQLKTALEKMPSFYASAQKLCDVYSELDDLERAQYYSDKWLAGAPGPVNQAAAYTKRASTLWRFGKIDDAIKMLKRARQFAPDYTAPVSVGGEMYKSIGDTAAAHELYISYLSRYKDLATTDTLGMSQLFGSLRLLMEADLPPAQVIPSVKKIAESEKRPFYKQMIELHLGLLYLRNGEYEAAKEFCDNQSRDFLDLLTKFPAEGRSYSWKYPIESIRLEPKQDDLDLSYLNQIVAAGQETGRKDIEVMGRLLIAQYNGKYGQEVELASAYRAVGIPLEDQWRIIGPFENRAGFHKIFPPEKAIDLEASYESGIETVKWQAVDDGAYDGYVDLKGSLPASSWKVAYGVIYVHSPIERKVQLRLSSDEACKLWLNDKPVLQIYRSKESALDSDIISVVLHPGDNKVLIKVANSIEDWGFYLRVTDEKGDGLKDIEFRAAGETSTFASRTVEPAID